jgi:hypothetical protein
VFSPALNGVGPEGTIGTPGAVARNGDPTIDTDAVEIVGTEDVCPALAVCNLAAGVLQTREPLPTCMPGAPAGSPGLVAITDNITVSVHSVVAAGALACPLGDAGQNGSLTPGPALAPWAGGLLALSPPGAKPNNFLFAARIARYRIGPSGEALEALANEPALWRSSTGRYTIAGATPDEPGAPGSGFDPAAPGPWQLVARGIEDLQLEYQYRLADGTLVWENVPRLVVAPPAPAPPDFTTIARAVRVTLSARAVAVNVQGQTSAGAGSAGRVAIRGQLARVVAPRATLMALQMNHELR